VGSSENASIPSPVHLVRSIFLVLKSLSKRKAQICRELLTGYEVFEIRNTICIGECAIGSVGAMRYQLSVALPSGKGLMEQGRKIKKAVGRLLEIPG
jgi:hypothetical protein